MKEKTSRSQKINVNSFYEKLSSSDKTGRPVDTREIQTRSSEDSRSLNVEQAHDRTGRPVNDTAAVQNDPQVYHEAETLNVDEEVLRERMAKSIVVYDENHESMMVNEADMDFEIPGLPDSFVQHAQSTSVRELIQRIENLPNRHALQQDLRQNQSLNPFSPESCTCGHFLRKGKGKNQKFIKFTVDLLSIPQYVKKRRPHGHRYSKKPETGNIIRPTS